LIFFLKKKWALFTTFQLTTDDTAGLNKLEEYIYPSIFVQNTTITGSVHTLTLQYTTPLSYLAYLFRYWRGGIKIKIKFVKTQLVSGRVEVIFNPSLSVPTDETQKQTTLREVIDIRLASEVTIELPWLLPVNYLKMSDPSGMLIINVVNPLKSPDGCSTLVDALIYISGADDLEYANVCNTKVPVPIINTNLTSGFDASKVLRRDDIKQSFKVEAKMDTITNDGAISDQIAPRYKLDFAQSSIGENFTSIKQLISRYNVLSFAGMTAPTTPQYFVPYFWSAAEFFPSTGNVTIPSFGGDIMSYLAPMYASYKGGLKMGAMANDRINTQWRLYTNYQNPGDIFGTLTSPVTGLNYATNQSIFANSGIVVTDETIAYIKAPYYCRTRYSLVDYQTDDGLAAYLDDPETVICFDCADNESGFTFFRAADDDFQFANFVSTPLLLIGYT